MKSKCGSSKRTGAIIPIQGLLATSGAVAIVLGLAFQSTLSDVFSGGRAKLSR
jgi:hypothetical protein